MTKSIDEILAPKPLARPRIYAYAINDVAHHNLLKIGQTTRDVKQRVAEQTKTAAIKATILLDESAERDDGSIISDHDKHLHTPRHDAHGVSVLLPQPRQAHCRGS